MNPFITLSASQVLFFVDHYRMVQFLIILGNRFVLLNYFLSLSKTKIQMLTSDYFDIKFLITSPWRINTTLFLVRQKFVWLTLYWLVHIFVFGKEISETTYLPSQDRGKAAYAPPFVDHTCDIIMCMFLFEIRRS